LAFALQLSQGRLLARKLRLQVVEVLTKLSVFCPGPIHIAHEMVNTSF
jgi:hypothetical protein